MNHYLVAWLLCAWVLWESTIPPSGPRTWELADSYKTERDCRFVADLFNVVAENEVTKHSRASLDAVVKGQPEPPFPTVKMQTCLPDTIDPRGPKR